MRMYRTAMAIFAALIISAAASAAPAGFQGRAGIQRPGSNSVTITNRPQQRSTGFSSRVRHESYRYHDGRRYGFDHRYAERGRRVCYVRPARSNAIFSFAAGVIFGSAISKEKPAPTCHGTAVKICESCGRCPAEKCLCGTCRETCPAASPRCEEKRGGCNAPRDASRCTDASSCEACRTKGAECSPQDTPCSRDTNCETGCKQ